MFIKQLNPLVPPHSDDLTDNEQLYKADDYIREIKNSLRETFPNFHNDLGDGEAITYSVTDLYGMHKFITANETDLIYKGPTTGTIKNILAVTKDKVVYARAPRSMFFAVLWFRLTQSQLDSFYPDTYIQLNGNNNTQITGKTINRLLGPAFNTLTVPDLRNRYLRGSLSSNSNSDESIKLDATSLKIYTTEADIVQSTTATGNIHKHHAGFAGTSRNAAPIGPGVMDGQDQISELSQSGSPTTAISADGHVHTFAKVNTPIAELSITKPTTLEQKIRPATYNLYPYMRIN